jgi:hypothetical protein
VKIAVCNVHRHGLETAGFTDIEITPTHQVADGIHSAIICPAKPATTATQPIETPAPTSAYCHHLLRTNRAASCVKECGCEAGGVMRQACTCCHETSNLMHDSSVWGRIVQVVSR